ncbi:MAG: YsnF/AvaK domain-containing protein [Bryobacteraceae bacterium]
MDRSTDEDVVVPVIQEELHADAIPVQTGSVRVTKHVHAHDEILQQELRKGRVEVKRVKSDRVVDGPQQVRREGNTLIIPVVSEVLRIEKQWVVTEEIHVTQVEERETVQQKVTVNREEAEIERLDEKGNVVSTLEAEPEPQYESGRRGPTTLVGRNEPSTTKKKVLSGSRSMLRKRPES